MKDEDRERNVDSDFCRSKESMDHSQPNRRIEAIHGSNDTIKLLGLICLY